MGGGTLLPNRVCPNTAIRASVIATCRSPSFPFHKLKNKIVLMATSDDASHFAALADSLQRLKVQQRSTTSEQSGEENLIQDSKRSACPISKDGYGFRSPGISTPLTKVPLVDGVPHSQLPQELLVPDLNGLGWPGAFLSPR